MGDASGASGTGEAVLAVNSNSKAGNDASAADPGSGTYLGSSSDLTLTDNATTEDLTADRTVGGESGEDEGGDDGVGPHSASQLGSGGGDDLDDDDDVYVLDGEPPPPPDSPPPPLDGDHSGGGDGDDPNPPRDDRSESTSSSMSIDRNALLNDDDLMVLAAVPARGPLARGSSDPTLTDNATSTATGTSDTDDELDDWERFEDDMLCSSDGGDVGVGGSGVRLGGSGEGGTSADGTFSDRASKRQSLIIETSFDDLSFLEDEEAMSPSDPLFASNNNGLLAAAAGEGGENEALSALREKLSLMNFSRKRERRPTGDRALPGQRRTRSLSDGDMDESVMRKLRRRRAQDDAFGFSPTSDASERSFDDTLIFEVDMTDEIIRDLQGEGKYSGLGSRVVSAPVDIDAESSAESDDAARSPTSPLAGAIGNGGRQKAKSIGGRRNSKSRGVSTGLAKEAFANRLAMIKNKTNLSKVASMPSVAEVAAEVRSIAEASALSFPAPSDLPDPMFDLEIGGSDEAGSSDDPAPRSRSPSRKGKRPRQLSSTLKRGASLADLRESRSQRQGRALSVSTIAHELAHDLSERALEIQALEDQLADHRFNVEDSEDNIIFEKEDAAAVQQQNQGRGRKQKVRQLVRAATLEKLVERLTFDRFVDRSYMSAFLLTFRSFVTPSQLMALLRVRFVATPPDGLRGEELQVWKKTKQIPIRLRVMNALKVWIEHHFDDFAQSKELVEALSGFMDLMIAVDMAKQAEHLRKLLLKQLSGGGRTNAVVATGDPPTPHKIPSKKKLSLLDIHPEEVARQLTVVESKMFRAIEATELLGLAWSKDGREERARNVLAMSGRFNEVSRWVATEVLASPRTKVRAVVINRFITIAHKCRLLHNFNSTMEIMAGLQLAPVHRLKQSWALIPTKGMELFDDLVSLVAQYKNFTVMRRVLRSVGEAACVPYLGIYLTDLTFVEEGNPNMISSVLPLHFVYSGDNDFVSHEFDTRTTINDVRAEIVAELGSAIDDAQDRLLWLPGRDPASPGVWLPLNHRLRDHDIQSNSMIHLRSRHAIIRVRVEDNFKSMRLDLTNSVSALVEAIVAGLRLPNPEDFLLVTEDDRALQPNLALWEQGINAENEVLKIKFNFIQKAITPASDPRLIQILYDRASKLVRSVACPVAKEYAVLLTSLSVLAATGGSADIGALDILDFVPLDWAEKYNKKMAKAIRSQIKELATTGITDVEAKVQFFELTSRQPSYGGEVLSCGMRVKKKVSPVHIALKNKTLVIMDAKTNTVVGSYQLDAVRSLRRDADEVYWQLPKALVKREVICFIFPEVRMAKWHFMMVQEHLREMDVLPPPSHNYIPIARNLLAQISAGRGASGGAEQETIHLINFAKRRRTYEIVATIQHFQKTSRKYALTPLPALIRWLDDRPRMDEDDLHARSREVEERVPR